MYFFKNDLNQLCDKSLAIRTFNQICVFFQQSQLISWCKCSSRVVKIQQTLLTNLPYYYTTRGLVVVCTISKNWFWLLLMHYTQRGKSLVRSYYTIIYITSCNSRLRISGTIMCRNDELSWTMIWVGCLLTAKEYCYKINEIGEWE